MQRQGFEEYARNAHRKDARFEIEAYLFLRDALDFTVRNQNGSTKAKHVRGQELLAGFRELALKEFGPMALTILDYWGVKRCEDVGAMVFNLVEAGAFGRTEEDSPEDFVGGYDFTDAFVTPFLPSKKNSQNTATTAESRDSQVRGKASGARIKQDA